MPDAPEPLILYPRRGRLAVNGFIFLLGCMFASVCGIFHLEEKKIAVFYISIVVALLIFLYVIARFARALRSSPGLVLHADGLYEDTKLASYGLIPWDNVAGAEINPRTPQVVSIILIHSDEIMQKMSRARCVFHTLFYGPPNMIRIPSYFFNYNHKSLMNKINEFVEYYTPNMEDTIVNICPSLKINKYGKIVLHQKNFMLSILAGSLLFLTLLILISYHHQAFNEISRSNRYYFKLLFISPVIVVWSIGTLARALQIHKPALVISRQGLYDGLWPASYGLIPWEMIKTVELRRTMTLTIRLQDSAASKNLSWWKLPIHLFFYLSLQNIYIRQAICPVRLLEMKKCIAFYMQAYSGKQTPT